MARLRRDFVDGIVENDPLGAGATTLNSAALARLPVVEAPDVAVVVLDPDGEAPEIVHVTAHAADATSATIVRGREGTDAAEHAFETRWVHAPTATDFGANVAVAEEGVAKGEFHTLDVHGATVTDEGDGVGKIAISGGDAGGGFQGAKIFLESNQDVMDTFLVFVALDTVVFDSDGFADLPNNRILIPEGFAGIWRIEAGILYPEDNTQGTFRGLQIQSGGIIALDTSPPHGALAGHGVQLRASALIEVREEWLPFGISLRTSQDSGGTRQITGAEYGTYLSAEFRGSLPD